MISAPRFVNINGQLHLVVLGLEEGAPVSVSVVQCMGNPGESKEDFVKGLLGLVQRASHESPILEWEDLPEELRAKYESKSEPVEQENP